MEAVHLNTFNQGKWKLSDVTLNQTFKKKENSDLDASLSQSDTKLDSAQLQESI